MKEDRTRGKAKAKKGMYEEKAKWNLREGKNGIGGKRRVELEIRKAPSGKNGKAKLEGRKCKIGGS